MTGNDGTDGADAAFTAMLVTHGRKTGREHRVRLRAVSLGGLVYFSRHRPDSDWYLNAAANPSVSVIFGGALRSGTAHVVADDAMLCSISRLKYPGDPRRAGERRVAIGVSLGAGDEPHAVGPVTKL